MKNRIKIYSSVFFLTFFLSGFSQNISEKETFEDAEYFFASEDYSEALSAYLRLYKRGFQDNANINYRIGICYLNSSTEKDKAASYLEKAVKNVSEKYNEGSIKETNAPFDAYLYLGNALRINMQLDQAIEAYQKFISLSPVKKEKAKKTNLDKDWAKAQIESCKRAKTAILKPVRIKTVPLNKPINTSSANYDPVVTSNEDKLIYITHQKFYDAIYEVKKVKGIWSDPVNITPDIQSDGNQYPCFLSQDGKTLLLSKQENGNSDIYISHFEDNKWTPSEPLNKEINTKYWESHACISPDGKTLYFTSDRPQSKGGTDIFVSEIGKNNDWGPVKNIGNEINSEFNEESPFITEDGKTLYFSSQGHETLGGYDIFYSTKNDSGKWSKPVNLDYPINTTDDDLFFVPVKNGTYAYQALYLKKGAGDLDIVRMEIFSKDHPFKFGIQGNIADMVTKAKPDKISIYLINPDNNQILDSLKPAENGAFEFKQAAGTYQVHFALGNFKTSSNTFTIPEDYPQDNYTLSSEMQAIPSQFDEFLASRNKEPVKEQKIVEEKVVPINTQPGIISDVLFAFNEYNLSADAEKEVQNLLLLMKSNPSLEIEILGHADSKGSDNYNNRLSKKRAKTIRDKLIDAGIANNRVAFKGWGKTKPIAINENPDGTDNPEGRALNRRAEFCILKCDNKNITVKRISVPDNLKIK